MTVVTQTYQSHSYSLVIEDKEDKFDYAYYIYNNKKRINVIMYSLNKTLNIDTNGLSGILQVRVFLRDKKTKEKNAFFLTPIKIKRKIVLVENIDVKHDLDQNIAISNFEIPVILKKKENVEKLFIFLNGAISVDTQEKLYPYFSRISWSDKFNGHCLYLYDASLNISNDYTLGWYRGNNIKLNDKYVEIIKKFAELLNVSNRNIYFYGSSGGGFAALKFAESFPKATAIAINPQINCLNYAVKNVVEKFKTVFPDHNNLSEIQIDHTKFQKDRAKMILVQNVQDVRHYENHFKPFWAHFDKDNNLMNRDDCNHAILYDHESGHGGEPPEVFEKIISLVNS